MAKNGNTNKVCDHIVDVFGKLDEEKRKWVINILTDIDNQLSSKRKKGD